MGTQALLSRRDRLDREYDRLDMAAATLPLYSPAADRADREAARVLIQIAELDAQITARSSRIATAMADF